MDDFWAEFEKYIEKLPKEKRVIEIRISPDAVFVACCDMTIRCPKEWAGEHLKRLIQRHFNGG